ncbi:hypothetical protein DQZ30_15395 [Salmonella enterica subsp. diarizonae]|nr:hypothetical protein [Salmonella enterica]ECI4530300.1 hypothetical protein [Salmonella enterica subsp. diarizonae]
MVCQPKAHRVATGTATLQHRKNRGYFGSLFLWTKKKPGMTDRANSFMEIKYTFDNWNAAHLLE